MAVMVSFQEWFQKYVRELGEAGVGSDDAATAAHLGWAITLTDQACYGVESATPVHFMAHPNPRDGHIVAGCGGARFKSEECYLVYAPHLTSQLDRMEAEYGGQVDRHVLMAGIAVHEVRHRIQDREAASVRLFSRTKLAGDWHDAQAAQVALNMYQQFAEWEAEDRAAGVPAEVRDRLYSDDEFDAAVVERLLLHR